MRDRNPLLDTFNWFKKAVPNVEPVNFTTQMGVHFEEVAEMIAEVTPADDATRLALVEAKMALVHLADHLKAHPACVNVELENRVDYLDALNDQIVTAVGCGYMAHMDIVGAAHAVNTSNYSKFVDGEPIFNENKKVMKGPDYVKADLTPFV
jgi:hypothetical protein